MTVKLDLKHGFDLERLISDNRESTAIEAGKISLSYSKIKDLIGIALFNLKNAGINEGGRIAVFRDNSPYHLILLLASWLMKALFIPLNFKMPLKSLMENIDIDLLIYDGPSDGCPAKIIKPDDILDPSADMVMPEKFWPIGLEQESSIIFTSGSTGTPKGVVHTVGNYIYSALGTIERLEMDKNDRWLVSLPLYHVGGLLIFIRTLIAGGTSVFPDTTIPMERSLIETAPTIISLVPTQLIRFIESENLVTAMKKMKAILLGGAPSPSWLIDRALDLGLPIIPTYGSTESCAQATAVTGGAGRDEFHTAGKPLPYRDVSIGEGGLVVIKGKTVFKHYISGNEIITIPAKEKFVTSDMGEFDSRGNLVILGRSDQVFISGGENINPFEIEGLMMEHENILWACAVPAPHKEFGTAPWAFFTASGRVDEDELKSFLRKKLPSYKVPKKIILLQNNSGEMKFDRAGLIDKAAKMAREE